jgi:O-antigen/teichoic acid export membrane protein
MSNSGRRLRSDIALGIIQSVAQVVIAAATAITIARLLGPDGNGKYAIAILLPTLLAMLINLGVAPANAYFISSGRVSLAVARSASLRIWIGLTIAGSALAVVMLLWGASLFRGVPVTWLWLALIAFPFALLTAFSASLLHGRQDFPRYYAAILVSPIATLLFISLFLVTMGAQSKNAIAGFVLGQATGSGVALALLHSVGTDSGPDDPAGWRAYARRCLAFGWKAHLGNVLTYLNYRADIFLVNLLLSPADTGIYLVAVQIVERVWILSVSASSVILPRLSRSYARQREEVALTAVVARWVFAASLLGAAAIALVARYIIYLLFGSAFLAAERALLWLLPGVVLASLSHIVGSDIDARGRPELNLMTALVVTTVNVAANLVLIPRFGIVGAAIASTIAYTLGAVLRVVIYARLGRVPWWRVVVWERGDARLLRELLPGFRRHAGDSAA